MKRSDIRSKPMAERVVAALEPEDKAYRVSDGAGLYLYVRADATKSWELRYRKPDGKYSWLGLGSYPDVKPKEARQRATDTKELIAKGTTPRQHKKAQEQQAQTASRETVAALMDEWHGMKAKSVDANSLRKVWLSIQRHLIPAMGHEPISRIQPAYILEFFRKLEALGIHATSAKIRRALAEAFDMAAFAGRVSSNPVRGVERFIESGKGSNYAHVTQQEVPALMRAIDQYPRSPQVRVVMLLLALNGCRPGELRQAAWSEFDLENGLWDLPAERTKKRRAILMPLAPQSVALLRDQYQRSGSFSLVFPNRNDPRKPMSNMAVSKALEHIGYAGRQTGHGFRHILSTALNERGYNADHIEAQLAHVTGNIRSTYNKALYLEPRRAMVQTWADEIYGMIGAANNILSIQKEA
ncbi:tyrosine-type recombinase/integrase [Vreelandella maris]|uniref:Tyrosine-type recombinase/integrase n=1 Tax=Vreelandella maris TaxID=2729617 RepID=A0A7Y6RC11_9GAMM|nr:tyrosine-type recombinase/integrase [Halomonas maris]NVF13749.1 tyrosine-type recombinase/integrase [Halomonas maris]|tara:strand:- start:9300 stop:10535 length:1236 start_codon:yes stop_codon:yes gene_type:complete